MTPEHKVCVTPDEFQDRVLDYVAEIHLRACRLIRGCDRIHNVGWVYKSPTFKIVADSTPFCRWVLITSPENLIIYSWRITAVTSKVEFARERIEPTVKEMRTLMVLEDLSEV